MNPIGKFICIIGTIGAVIFPPYLVLGQRHWGFILDDIIAAFGQSVKVYDHIDHTTLLLEVLVVNVFGIAVMFMSKGKKRRKR